MSVNQFIKLIETVGIPVLVAAVSGYALWYIIRWILVKFSDDFHEKLNRIASEIDEEQRDTRNQIKEIKMILIRLVDRTRLLSEELSIHDQVARSVWKLNPKAEKPRTRAERRDELEEQLREIGKNGD